MRELLPSALIEKLLRARNPATASTQRDDVRNVPV
jgi:hypothetical protein